MIYIYLCIAVVGHRTITSTWEVKIGQFYFLAGNHRSFLRRRASLQVRL